MFASHVAVYVLFPTLPFAIVTFSVACDNPVPVQPLNVYPIFVGFVNVIALLFTVYVVAFAGLTVAPSNPA